MEEVKNILWREDYQRIGLNIPIHWAPRKSTAYGDFWSYRQRKDLLHQIAVGKNSEIYSILATVCL